MFSNCFSTFFGVSKPRALGEQVARSIDFFMRENGINYNIKLESVDQTIMESDPSTIFSHVQVKNLILSLTREYGAYSHFSDTIKPILNFIGIFEGYFESLEEMSVMLGATFCATKSILESEWDEQGLTFEESWLSERLMNTSLYGGSVETHTIHNKEGEEREYADDWVSI